MSTNFFFIVKKIKIKEKNNRYIYIYIYDEYMTPHEDNKQWRILTKSVREVKVI